MEKETGTIQPYLFEGHIVIALHPDWLRVFNGIPTVVVSIDETNRLHLVIQKVNKNGQDQQYTEKI